jgi:enoyl-CoA hydratase/carnithine racemase
MCIGGSLELSLSCDFRLASSNAQYWFPEMQFGMVPLSGGISRLTRIVGPHWANWMAVANKKISAERALTIGLVTEIVERDSLVERAQEIARVIAGQPAAAVQGTVKVLWQSLNVARAQALDSALLYTQVGNPIGTADLERGAVKPSKPWLR